MNLVFLPFSDFGVNLPRIWKVLLVTSTFGVTIETKWAKKSPFDNSDILSKSQTFMKQEALFQASFNSAKFSWTNIYDNLNFFEF